MPVTTGFTIESVGAVDWLTLDRQDRLNAINQPMAEGLLAYFESKRRDAVTRVIVMRGAGRGFCSGADLKAMEEPDRLLDGPNGDWTLRDMLKAMRSCPQPVVALVHGAVAGGGLAIALAADILLAGRSASFHSAFIRIGLSGTELGVSWRLQRTIGVSRAREMLLTGKPMRAEEAAQTGLVSRVVEDEDLRANGEALVADMLRAAPDALRVSKRSFDASLEVGSYELALEVEERGQIPMVRQAIGRFSVPPKD